MQKLALLLLLCLSFGVSANPSDRHWSFSGELGAGVKHTTDNGFAALRVLYGKKRNNGCGVLLSAWNGDESNHGVGLTCRTTLYETDRRKLRGFFEIGLVDIEPSRIVNSDYALHAHFSFSITERVALGISHYSNAGQERPNRGFNFISLEFNF